MQSRWLLSAGLVLAGSGAMGADGCSGDETSPEPEPEPEAAVVLGDYEVLVPFAKAVDGVAPQPANNNLDVASFGGRTFLAWRTAPTHFASPDVELYVASEGPDGWRFEGRFAVGTDLREPRFLVLGERLILYFAQLGEDFSKFEPVGTFMTEYVAPGEWTEPEQVYEPTFIPWRAKVLDGKAYVTGYTGGANIYEFDGEPIRVHFLTTTDGRTFEPVVPGKPIVQEGGGSETDFTFLDDGSLIAVTRNEAGDAEFGFGSKICTAPKDALADWTCKADKKKYDSPLVFSHAGRTWLVGRRHLSETGEFDLGRDDLSLEERSKEYAVDYSFKPKRCALWELDPEAVEVRFVTDLPSRGDTCFPSQLPKSESTVTIFNYTNALDGAPDCASWPDACDDLSWWVGQGKPTVIYRIDVGFPAP